MKRLTVLLAVLMLCLQVFSGTVAYGATIEDNISILNHDIVENITSIHKGDQFTVTVTLKNLSISDALSDINVTVDSTSSFYGTPTSGAGIGTLAIGPGESKTLPKLVYKGTGNDLNLTFTYTKGTTICTENETIYIGEAVPTDNTPSQPTDTSGYEPKLSTDNSGRMPIIAAGSSYKLKYVIRNTSYYQAKNVKVSLKMDAAKAPLVLENYDLRQTIPSINANESAEVVFDVNINKTSPEGIFPLELKYEYNNAYTDSKDFSSSDTVYFKIENNNIPPRLNVVGISAKPSVTISDAVTLELKVKNLGNLAAKDLKVTLTGLKSGGFTAYNSTDVKYVNSIGGNDTATVTYELLPPSSGAAGSNELTVKFDYKDAAGNAYTDQNQIFVPAGDGEGSRPNIAFEQIASPQNAVAPGEEFTVGLDLKNNGGAIAKNIKVSLSADAGIVTRSMNPVYLTELSAKKAQKISFKLFASDDITTKNYPIALNVEYEDAFGNKFNASQYIGVFIENNNGKTVPRIIIDNYSMDPFPVNAGEDFTLKMSFLNTSKTVDVSNIKVTVTSDDGTFTPTDSGNTFYLEGIPKTQKVERDLVLHVKPDAEQKSYMLTVNFEYEDEKGNPFTAKETMSVRVLQNPRLVTGEINMMQETFVGQPMQVYLDFYNMGKSTLYNLMVSVEGDFQGQGLSYYVGNFEPGRTDFFDVSFTPMNAGQQKGSVLFAFEDSNGKKTEVRKEFELNVMEMQQGPMLDENGMPIDGGFPGKDGMPGMEGMPGMPGAAKPSILLYVGIGAGVLVVAVVLFIILRKRHLKRKEMTLDE